MVLVFPALGTPANSITTGWRASCLKSASAFSARTCRADFSIQLDHAGVTFNCQHTCRARSDFQPVFNKLRSYLSFDPDRRMDYHTCCDWANPILGCIACTSSLSYSGWAVAQHHRAPAPRHHPLRLSPHRPARHSGHPIPRPPLEQTLPIRTMPPLRLRPPGNPRPLPRVRPNRRQRLDETFNPLAQRTADSNPRPTAAVNGNQQVTSGQWPMTPNPDKGTP